MYFGHKAFILSLSELIIKSKSLFFLQKLFIMVCYLTMFTQQSYCLRHIKGLFQPFLTLGTSFQVRFTHRRKYLRDLLSLNLYKFIPFYNKRSFSEFFPSMWQYSILINQVWWFDIIFEEKKFKLNFVEKKILQGRPCEHILKIFFCIQN